MLTLGTGFIRQRWRRWWLNRQPRRDTLALTHRNLYILPTRAGLMLVLTLLLLLVGSINYQLNLGYLLTFLLAGSAVVSMHVAHNNLRGLQLHLQTSGPVFAGQAAPVTVTLHNPLRRPRYGIGLRWMDMGPSRRPGADTGIWTDVPAGAASTVELACPTQRRGRMALPPLTLETRFPIGAFRVWCWWQPAVTLLVCPAPETPAPPLPLDAGAAGPDAVMAQGLPGDEFEGIRPYRRGDPLKWVAWKKAAKAAEGAASPWVSREFSTHRSAQLWLDAARCGVSGTEAQLSRLCAWVLEAEAAGLDYGLRLTGQDITPGHGPQHQRHCLEALALC